MGKSVVTMQKPLSVILQLLNWNITERGFLAKRHLAHMDGNNAA